MTSAPPGFVDVVRDFLAAHRALRGLFALFRAASLRFGDLDPVFVDDESSVLFRLKERCHALFRPRPGRARETRHREVLFDLAVGSLFHEVMKFRENFYQREVYGPQVRALRADVEPAAASLFLEFEKILDAVSARLGEGLEEIETLLGQTRSQLLLLLAEHADDGLVMRSLIEHRAAVEECFGRALEDLFAELHAGRPAPGFALAGRSYLESGHYELAEGAFADAAQQGGDPQELGRQAAYARGMRAYLAGDYAESVAQLERWVRGAPAADVFLAGLAHAAVSKLERLVQGSGRAATLRAAGELAGRLASLRGQAQAGAALRRA
ncbi:MAG TPA: hypothetical protein VFC77_08325 [Myxococcota bacterium]|nr:hypothetical protein [Myxococcota bacterium]